MSGGVDSSVAAYFLREQGHEVIGLFMRTGTHTDAAPSSALPVIQPEAAAAQSSHKRGCCSAADAGDARRVADQLNIPFYAMDFEQEFDQIIDYFVGEYTEGRTPNPCVMCNNWLKFGRLWEFAQQIGADHIATGHYARAQDGCLFRSLDPAKDQSYVLYGIRREILPHLLFPIGEYSKPKIRAVARELGMQVADKPDSQEICFVPSDDYQQLIRERRPEFDGAGEVVDMDGNVVARHDGFDKFTIGQRKGLRVAFGERRYVVRIDADNRRVVVGSRDDLLGRSLWADRMNWLCDQPTEPLDCTAKIRYHHAPAAATVTTQRDGSAHIEFQESQSAITPGQSVVIYDGDRVLGGGTIR
jgi:tRNA-specific 2-thiouridylase